MTASAQSAFKCHVCGGEVPVADAPALDYLVGSDCTPVKGNVRVGVCRHCGLAQKETSAEWRRICAEVYGNYQIYHQAAGSEQKARNLGSGALAPRSSLIADFLKTKGGLSDAGAVIDIGCGNGAFLRGMSMALPGWRITGSDLNANFRDEICGISASADFLSDAELKTTTRQFDVVSFIHCIEHIPDPVAYLADARRLVRPNGFLLIQVPDAELNPFDFVVADHSSHLGKTTMAAIVEAAGYAVAACGNLVIAKEITLLARPLHSKAIAPLRKQDGADGPALRNLAWLGETMQTARRLSQRRPFGIFGTSIASMWATQTLDYKVDFFVDEDPVRIGRDYFGAPILTPSAVPDGSVVFVCLEPTLASQVIVRHKRPGIVYVAPAPLG